MPGGKCGGLPVRSNESGSPTLTSATALTLGAIKARYFPHVSRTTLRLIIWRPCCSSSQ